MGCDSALPAVRFHSDGRWQADCSIDLIDLGDVVSSRVTADDPLCSPGLSYRCRYYRLTAPSSGVLTVTMTWNPQIADPYPLDIEVIDPDGRITLTTAAGAQRRVSLPVSEGATYVIEIWASAVPGEPFGVNIAIVPR